MQDTRCMNLSMNDTLGAGYACTFPLGHIGLHARIITNSDGELILTAAWTTTPDAAVTAPKGTLLSFVNAWVNEPHE